MLRFMVVKLTSTPRGRAELGRMSGNTGAPVCPGERLTLTWVEAVRAVVFSLDSSALASARKGTRSKNRPKLPRTTVRRESKGDQAKPARGETLLVSVAMVFKNCRS